MAEIKGILQYYTATVSGSNSENLTNIVNNLGEKKRKIEHIWFAPTWVSSPTNTLYAVAKIQQTEILLFDLSNFMDLDTDTDQFLSVQRGLAMDCVLERGEAFNVGFSKSGATPGGTVSIAYRDLE